MVRPGSRGSSLTQAQAFITYLWWEPPSNNTPMTQGSLTRPSFYKPYLDSISTMLVPFNEGLQLQCWRQKARHRDETLAHKTYLAKWRRGGITAELSFLSLELRSLALSLVLLWGHSCLAHEITLPVSFLQRCSPQTSLSFSPEGNAKPLE